MVAFDEFSSRYGAPPKSIIAYVVEIRGGTSGGTIASALNMFDQPLERLKRAARSHLLDEGSTASLREPDAPSSLSFVKGLNKWTAPFFMASTNSQCVPSATLTPQPRCAALGFASWPRLRVQRVSRRQLLRRPRLDHRLPLRRTPPPLPPGPQPHSALCASARPRAIGGSAPQGTLHNQNRCGGKGLQLSCLNFAGRREEGCCDGQVE